MIKPTAVQAQIRLLRLILGWEYASRSGPYHVGQGCRSHPRLSCLYWLGGAQTAPLL